MIGDRSIPDNLVKFLGPSGDYLRPGKRSDSEAFEGRLVRYRSRLRRFASLSAPVWGFEFGVSQSPHLPHLKLKI